MKHLFDSSFGSCVYFLNSVSLPHQFLEQSGKRVVLSVGACVLIEVQLCFYVQGVLELVTSKEEGRE